MFTMKMRMHGAAGTVTGTMTELYCAERGIRGLIDCGAFEGGDANWASTFDPDAERPADRWPFDPKELTFVLLTHAHRDHCGRLAELVRCGFRGKVFATAATRKLATAQLMDAVKFSGGRFDEADVRAIPWEVGRAEPYMGWFPIAQDVFALATRSSHLLGAVGWALNWGTRRKENPLLVVSGDVGPHADKNDGVGGLISRNQSFGPEPTNRRTTLVLESTYGLTGRKPPTTRKDRREALAKVLEEALASSSKVLIPAFAFGRVQEVLFDIWALRQERPHLRHLPVFTPGLGLSAEGSEAYVEHLFSVEKLTGSQKRKRGEFVEVRLLWANRNTFSELGIDLTTADGAHRGLHALRQALGLTGGAVRRITELEEFSAYHGPGVLVAPSGMGDGGFMRGALELLTGSASTIVATVGYAAPDSFVGQLKSGAPLNQNDQDRLAAFGPPRGEGSQSPLVSKARFRHIDGYGGHGGSEALCAYARHASGKYAPEPRAFDDILLVHGDDAARNALAMTLHEELRKDGAISNVHLPTVGAWFDLNTGRWSEGSWSEGPWSDAVASRAGTQHPLERSL